MTRYCLALDLKEDPALIAAYEQYHASVWPEIIASIKEAGIKALEIYRVSNRLFMIMEASDDFSFEKKAALDAKNEIVMQWEKINVGIPTSLTYSQARREVDTDA